MLYCYELADYVLRVIVFPGTQGRCCGGSTRFKLRQAVFNLSGSVVVRLGTFVSNACVSHCQTALNVVEVDAPAPALETTQVEFWNVVMLPSRHGWNATLLAAFNEMGAYVVPRAFLCHKLVWLVTSHHEVRIQPTDHRRRSPELVVCSEKLEPYSGSKSFSALLMKIVGQP